MDPSWNAPGYGPEDEVGLGEIAAVLRRRWKSVAVCLVLALGVASWYTWRQVPVWNASAYLRVADGQASPRTAQELFLQRAGGEIETERHVVETRPILERVVEDLSLGFRVREPAGVPRGFLFPAVDLRRPSEPATYDIVRAGEGWRLEQVRPEDVRLTREFASGDTVEIPGGTFVMALDSALRSEGADPIERVRVEVVPLPVTFAALRRDLAVERPDPNANLLELRYEGTDRFLVREVPNRVAHAFLGRRQQVQTSEARSEVAFLEEQNDRLERQLEAAEEELQRFREQGQVVALESQAEAQVQRLAQLRAERSGLAGERDALQNLLGSLGEGEGEPDYRRLVAFPTFLRNEAVQDVYSTLTEAEQERTEMLSRRTRRYPDVVALTEQIAQLEEELGEIGRNYLQSLDDQIASLDAELARFGTELEEVPGREVQYARLQRRTELLTELHTILQTRLREAEITANVEDPSVRIVESAVLPQEPVSPRPRRDFLFAGFLGLMMGVGLAFVREYSDSRIRDEDEIDRRLGVPVLSSVPRVPSGKRSSPRKQALAMESHGSDWSLAAESYRQLRTNVGYTRAGRGSRQVLVTSPGARDGKSTTAANLAITFAVQGLSTLLIDADLRRSVQHEAFGVEMSPGLSNHLVHVAGLTDVVRKTDLDDLHLIPSGDVPPNPAELLGGERMERLIEWSRSEYDAVVIDTPPALVVTDPSVLASKVEGVLMVVRADQTDRDAAEKAMEQLRHVGAKVLGVVFNDIGKGDRYGYRGQYYYDYYGKKDESSAWRRFVPFA